MKKTLLLMTISLMLFGCNKNSNNVIGGTTNSDSTTIPEITMEISNFTAGGLDFSPENLVIPSTSESSSLIVNVKNSSNEPVSFAPSIEEPSNGFKILTNRCGISVAAKKSCAITLSFSARGLYNGVQNSSLMINGTPINISSSVTGKPNPNTTGTAILEIYLNKPFDPLDGHPIRRLNIKNIGDGNAQNLLASISPEFEIWSNKCPSVLSPKKRL